MGKDKNGKIKWFEPQWLEIHIEIFKDFCSLIFSENKRMPIMICGDTGVGKTMFANIAIDLFKKSKNKDDLPVEKLNCALLDEKFTRSELFGYKKGAFTGANYNKIGLLKKADKGIVILDEIGELSFPIQAMLLTFIEDGYFYRLGDTESQNSEVQIIGTTNKKKNDFRDDFWFRFYSFAIPPLYRRRRDILHYIYHISPDFLKSLYSWEILVLLTYNWPGNVRELKRVLWNIKCESESRKKIYSHRGESNKGDQEKDKISLADIEKYNMYSNDDTMLDLNKLDTLVNDMEKFGINLKLFDKIINYYGLSISKSNMERPYLKINSYEDFEGVTYRMDRGLSAFNELFLQLGNGNYNLLDVKEGIHEMDFYRYIGKFCDKNKIKNEELFPFLKKILEYAIDAEIPIEMTHEIMIYQSKHYNEFKEILMQTIQKRKTQKLNDTNTRGGTQRVMNEIQISDIKSTECKSSLGEKESPNSKQEQFDILSMGKDELVKYYYKKCLERTKDNVEEAAKIAKEASSTFYRNTKELRSSKEKA